MPFKIKQVTNVQKHIMLSACYKVSLLDFDNEIQTSWSNLKMVQCIQAQPSYAT